jgi:putative nucleotidyltransferase with HDIG domain
MTLPSREEALQILEEKVKDDYQVMHSKMVATVLESYAIKFGEDKDLWYITGLLHDVDYFEYPNEHPNKSLEWFVEWGYPEELIEAVREHYVDHSNKKTSLPKLSATLIAVDELSGFLHAYSLMRPEGFEGMKASSVNKKLKDLKFAAKINREDINYGIEMMGIDKAEHIQFVVEVLSKF